MSDIYSILWWLAVVYFTVCIVIICMADSDILTFLYSQVGKDFDEAFDGKVVWITGASSGIGEGIAKGLSKCKTSKVVLSARRKDELERVKRECLANNPDRDSKSLLVLPLDMTDLSSHEGAFQKVLSTFGKLDILISNAGRSQTAKWHEIDIEVDRGLFELNLFSLIHLNRIVVRHFYEVGGGQLAVMSSLSGKVAGPSGCAYSGSKFALHGYFEGLRTESRNRNLVITLICPGPVLTEITESAFTSKIGKRHDGPSAFKRRMRAERSGYLSLVAIANKLEESWHSPFPFIPFMYLAAYQPFIFSKARQLFNK